jgi:hypothetical protein
VDCFWTASFSSSIYQCFKDGSSVTYSNPGLAFYGAAYVDFTNTWWAWTQDGNGCLATEFTTGGVPTGRTFDGDATIGGIAGGACAYDTGGDVWELCGLHQASPDTIAGYDLETKLMPLKVNTGEIQAWVGGTLEFTLNAGSAYANRNYVLFGGTSGSAPGINVGSINIPCNWDAFTTLLLQAMLPDFYGTLDGNGSASAKLVIPRHGLASDYTMTFAYGCANPWDYASNDVEVVMKAWVKPDYAYDDGTGESLLGWTSGGEMCWMHGFDSGPGDTIEYVSTVFGSTVYSGYGPGNGAYAEAYLWDDPSNDYDPADCVNEDMVPTAVANVDTDIFNDIALTSPKAVTGIFFVGVNLDHAAGQYVCPMDYDNTNTLAVWYAGDPGNASGGFDYLNIGNNTYGNYGASAVWLLRAIAQ